MSLYDGLGLEADEIAPFAAQPPVGEKKEEKAKEDDPEQIQKKKKVAAAGEGWSVSQSMFAAQMRRKQAEKAREKAVGSAKKKPAQSGPSLMKPLGHVETVTIIKRKADLENEQAEGNSNASSNISNVDNSETKNKSRSGSNSHVGGGSDARASTSSTANNGANQSHNANNTNATSGYNNSGSSKSNAVDAEPFREDPLARKEVKHPYSPWKPNDFELIRMKKKQQQQNGRDAERRRRHRPKPPQPAPRQGAAIAPPSFLKASSPPPERPAFSQ